MMRKAYRSISTNRRQLIPLLLVIAIVLAACGGGGGGEGEEEELSLTKQMSNYADTLSDEVDWLQDNIAYASNNRPDADRCKAKNFKHEPVELDEDTALLDADAETIVSNLDYVADRVKDARAQWQSFCNSVATGPDTANFMRQHLSYARQTLDNTITPALRERRRLELEAEQAEG